MKRIIILLQILLYKIAFVRGAPTEVTSANNSSDGSKFTEAASIAMSALDDSINSSNNNVSTMSFSVDGSWQQIVQEDEDRDVRADDGDDAAPCLVYDVLYKHGQQIERENECDYCLCIDGDMFCYWQCATTASSTNTASKFASNVASTSTMNSIIFTSTSNDVDDANTNTDDLANNEVAFVPSLLEKASSVLISSASKNQTHETTYKVMNDESTTGMDSTINRTDIASNSGNKNVDFDSTGEVTSNRTAVCVTKGNEYQVGDILPKDTADSCLECVCTLELKITCSPKNCASLQQDNYRHEAGSDTESMDMFDVDVF